MPVVPTDLLKMAMPQKTRTKAPIDTARHVRQGTRIDAASKRRRTRGPGNATKKPARGRPRDGLANRYVPVSENTKMALLTACSKIGTANPLVFFVSHPAVAPIARR